MRFFLQIFFKLLPWEIVSEVNEISLSELDKRGLIIWADEEID